jgi:hypothetical protein
VVADITDLHHIILRARFLRYTSSPLVKTAQHICLPSLHAANCWVSVGGCLSRNAMKDILHLRVEPGKLEHVYGIAHVSRRFFFRSGCGARLCQIHVVDICGKLVMEISSLWFFYVGEILPSNRMLRLSDLSADPS